MEIVLVHYMRGPKDGETDEMIRDDFMAFIESSSYKVIDAYVKDEKEHYDVGYEGSLTWGPTRT